MNNHEQPQHDKELRAQAEEKLGKLNCSSSQDLHSVKESLKLVQELQVHQIELEMQNEELIVARLDLEQALEKYSDLYDFAPIGYFTINQAKEITEANLAGANLLGIERSALVNIRLDLFISETDRTKFNNFLNHAFSSKVKKTCEVQIHTSSQKAIYVEMNALAFSSGRVCRLALLDITERKHAEQDHLITKKLESNSVLASGVAHDFNNLLTIVLLNIELAQCNATANEREIYLDEARKAALASRSLTQQLLALSQGGKPMKKPTYISEIIEEAVRSVFEGSSVKCDLSVDEFLWPVGIDNEHLTLVIKNLALNAIESMPHGGKVDLAINNVVLGPKEDPSLNEGNYVEIFLKDNGTGITEEVAPKIFDPYFSTKQRGTQKGMGLGLTICHSIINRNHGTIRVKSEVGKGSTFCVFIPASNSVKN